MQISFRDDFLWAQCGNYGNLLSRFFGKNFVKATYLLNKSLKSWFDGKFLVRVNFWFFHILLCLIFEKLFHEKNVSFFANQTSKWFHRKYSKVCVLCTCTRVGAITKTSKKRVREHKSAINLESKRPSGLNLSH